MCLQWLRDSTEWLSSSSSSSSSSNSSVITRVSHCYPTHYISKLYMWWPRNRRIKKNHRPQKTSHIKFHRLCAHREHFKLHISVFCCFVECDRRWLMEWILYETKKNCGHQSIYVIIEKLDDATTTSTTTVVWTLLYYCRQFSWKKYKLRRRRRIRRSRTNEWTNKTLCSFSVENKI